MSTFSVDQLYTTDRPLSVTLMKTGHAQSDTGGKPYFAYVLAGFIDTDDNGGTRKPVTIAGTDLAGWSDDEGMAAALADFLADAAERQERSTDGTHDRDGDLLPRYTYNQWSLLEQEAERLRCWAIDYQD